MEISKWFLPSINLVEMYSAFQLKQQHRNVKILKMKLLNGIRGRMAKKNPKKQTEKKHQKTQTMSKMVKDDAFLLHFSSMLTYYFILYIMSRSTFLQQPSYKSPVQNFLWICSFPSLCYISYCRIPALFFTLQRSGIPAPAAGRGWAGLNILHTAASLAKITEITEKQGTALWTTFYRLWCGADLLWTSTVNRIK